jgi:hypothetical protein
LREFSRNASRRTSATPQPSRRVREQAGIFAPRPGNLAPGE